MIVNAKNISKTREDQNWLKMEEAGFCLGLMNLGERRG